jgi:hypothetical protein
MSAIVQHTECWGRASEYNWLGNALGTAEWQNSANTPGYLFVPQEKERWAGINTLSLVNEIFPVLRWDVTRATT